jgi:hypothetical protein
MPPELLTVLATGGPWALVSLFVWLIYSGRLVPGTERDYWRKAFFAEQDLRREMQSTATVTRDVLRAIPEAPPGRETP